MFDVDSLVRVLPVETLFKEGYGHLVGNTYKVTRSSPDYCQLNVDGELINFYPGEIELVFST